MVGMEWRVRGLRDRLAGRAPAPEAIVPAYRPGPPPAQDPSDLDAGSGSRAELEYALFEAERLLGMAREACRAMEADLAASAAWARFESGHETRDVLQNGERRAHMEARYGRKVELADVEYEAGLACDQRRRRALEGIAKGGGPLPADAGGGGGRGRGAAPGGGGAVTRNENAVVFHRSELMKRTVIAPTAMNTGMAEIRYRTL